MATVKGTAAADQLAGTATADTISGLAENDTLNGLAGNDILIGGLGADELIGGSETDTASYATATVGVVLSLAAGSGTAGEALGDTFDSIENLIGSAKDDQLTGDDNANKIEGLALNDKLFGGKGADILDGGAGDDLIEGGEDADTLVGGAHTAGIGDTVSYANSVAAVTINLLEQGTYTVSTGKIAVTGATKAQTGGDAAGDLLSGIENVIGSAGIDKITGDANANIIEGGNGADILDGGTGIDTLSYAGDTTGVTVELGALGAITAGGGHATGDSGTGFENIRGGSGNDKLTGNTLANKLEGGAGNDTLIGGAGIDTLDGGNDSDTVDYSSALAFTVALALAGKTATVGGAPVSDAKGDILSNIENVIGGGGNDVITGNNFNNTILGGGGDDTIDGSTGDVDRLDGGAGINDTVSYASYAGTGVSANLSQQGTGDALTGVVGVLQVDLDGGDGDYLWNFENITGSKQNDILIGDGSINKIIGGVGADIIEGGAGADILDGGAATENNTLSYAGDTTGVTVALVAGKSATVSNGDAAGDDAKGFLNIIGGSNVDKLTGDAGNNTIEGGAGADILDGGAGASDTLSYASSGSVGVTLNEGANKATVSGGHAAGDNATNFENVAGSAFGDDLTGNSVANILNGAGGADYLEGRGGADKLIGGDGTDTAGYTLSAAPVTVNLSKQGIFNPAKNTIDKATAQSGGDAAGDLLAGIENVIGSAFNDTLTGDAANNKLEGELGNDRLEGGAGADILDGGDEIDTASYANALTGIAVSLFTESGTAGDAQGDQLISIENITGSGKDDIIIADDEQAVGNLFDGGAGLDTISYANLSTGPVSINLSTQGLTGTAVVGGTGSDKIVNFENAIGTGQGDTIIGSSVANVIEGGFGADILDGGNGIDTLSYAGSAIKVNVTLQEGINAAKITATGGDADGDSATNFENLRGSANNDILTGNSIANIVEGGDGNDTLSGLGGIDTLIGGKGDDTLNGGAAGDKLVGGDGIDTADYSTSALAVTIDLSKQGTFNALKNTIDKATAQKGGDAASDLLSGIENVIGSAQNDLFTGSAGANKFDGGGDDGDVVTYIASTVALTIDMLDGANGSGEAKGDTFVNVERIVGTKLGDTLVAGNDNVTLDGGDGDDTLVSGDEGDTLAGGAGIDTVSYRNASNPAGVTVDLALLQGPFNSATGQFTGPVDTQDASTGGDRYSSIENATGSSFGDTLKGNSGANRLDGGTGDDDLQGGLGDDFLEGGDGVDTANYSGVADSVTVNLATHRATGAGIGIGTDTLSNVERIVGTAVNDTLTGDEFDNELVGGDGDDILDGGAGADAINGGSGGETNGDTVTYVSATAGVTLSLLTPANSAGDAAGDTFTGIEIILGSNFADSIKGDGNENTLQGGKGNDTLDGGGDSDTLEGGDGDDILIGGADADVLKGGAGEDTASYETAVGVGVTLVLGGAGNGDASGDTFNSIENLTGSQYNDDLTGDGKDNVLTGGAGADQLTGGGGIDTLNYAGSDAAVTVAINDVDGGTGGHAQGDKSSEMENLIGSKFSDTLFGDNLANTISGGLGDDNLNGKAGNDQLDGGAGVDTVSFGTSLTNGVTVDLSTNTATGIDTGTDTLFSIENVVGSNKNDIIIGNNNVNVLDGGLGDDTLTGGESGDRFIIDDVGGNDTVTDFNFALDMLDFSKVNAATDFDSAKALAVQNGADIKFDFTGGHTLVLKDVQLSNLTAANFGFAPTDISLDVQGQNAVTVSEGLAIGGPVGTLIGTDDHDSGEGLIYKIESDPSGLFDIKNDQLVLKAGLDFENKAAHSVGIRVYDSTGASYFETLTVNVTDANDAPTDILIDQDTITEIAAVGDLVGTLSAADQDVPANTFTYTLLDKAGGLFALDGDQIKVAGALDFEGSAVHTITVKVDDGNGGTFTRSIDINIEDAVEGFGADGYVSGASVFYDADNDLVKDLSELGTTTDVNGEFKLKQGIVADLVLIGGTDISTGFEFHGIMKAPNGATVITPLTTLWAYLDDQYNDLGNANAATLTALNISGPINLNTYDPITAALSSDPAISGPGGNRLKSAMQVQHTIALLTGILTSYLIQNAGDIAAQSLAKTIFEDPGIEEDFGDPLFMSLVLDNAEFITGYNMFAGTPYEANIISAINAAVGAASGSGLALVEYLAQISAVVHLAATDFENGRPSSSMAADYTDSALTDLIDDQVPANVQGLNAPETINGTAEADTLSGFGGADELNGHGGNDVLDGGEGNDTVNGGDGRDLLIGGIGDDDIDGGHWFDNSSGGSFSDFDVVSYAYSTVGVSVDLGAGTATEGTYTDTITHVEGVIGSNFNDTLVGGANDFIESFQGGKGDDKIDGKSGVDRAIYSDAADLGGIAVNLAAGIVTTDNLGTDTLTSVEEIVGTANNDTFNAAGFGNFSTNAGSRGTYNAFRPGDGDDLIVGNGNTRLDYSDGAHGITIDLTTGVFEGGLGFGTDTFSGVNGVRGTAFDDVLIGGQDAYGQPGVSEVFTGGAGNDTIIGGSGFDVANYSYANDSFGEGDGIVVAMALGIVTGAATQVGNDTLRGVEGIIGTAGSDIYDAVGLSKTSKNAVAFNIGADEFEGGAGTDYINGSGNTRISYINSTKGLTIDLSSGNSVSGGQGIVTGDNSVGNDFITGGVAHIRGTRFDDTLIGYDNGANTAQLFEAADGNDIIDGRGGYDVANYLWDTSVKGGIVVNLAAGTVVGSSSPANNAAIGNDTLLSVEGVRGTNFADVFDATGFSSTTGANKGSVGTGANAFNTFEGGGGNDTVIGNGATRVEYGAATSGVIVTLVNDASGKGSAIGDSSVGFDTFNGGVSNIRGSSYDDVLTGNTNKNSIEGQGGNDIIRGGAGSDKLDGGEYMDGISASGMNDFDWLDYSSSTGAVTVNLYSFTNGPDAFREATDGLGSAESTHGFEAVIGGKGGDTLNGGQALFEIYQGGAGDDKISGFGGMDIASYVDATAGVTFNLKLGGPGSTFDYKVIAAGVGTDMLTNIEGIYGSAFDDTFNAIDYTFGSTGTNLFRGGGGNDTIIGNANATMIVGRTIIDYSDATAGMTINLTLGKVDGSHAGVGVDTFSGVNAVIGTNFDDVLIGGQADRNRTAFETNSGRFEVFDGGKGNDFIDGGSGFDYADYSRGIGALQTKGIHVFLADGIVIGDADVFGTDTLRGVEIIIGTQLDDIYDARGFGLSSTNGGYDSRQYGLIPVIDEVPGAYNEFTGGAGNDLIYGNGYTLLNYEKATAGIAVDLNLTAGAIVGKDASVGTDSIGGNVGDVRSIIGTNYADVITGNAFDNYIRGGFSKTSAGDVIDGGAGSDFIQGGSGDDKITGGTGNDFLGGGSPLPGTGQVSSNDTFYFEAGDGYDMIFDFNLSAAQGEHDVIVIEGVFTDFNDLLSHTQYNGGFTYIHTDGGTDNNTGNVIVINTPGPTAYVPQAQDFVIIP